MLPGSNLIVSVGPPLFAGAESRLICAEVAWVALPQVLSSDKLDASALRFSQFDPTRLLAKIVFTMLAVPVLLLMLLAPVSPLFIEKVQLVRVNVPTLWMPPPLPE